MKSEEILKEVSEKKRHRMASIPVNSDLDMVLDAMETYATQKQNDIDELVEFIKEAHYEYNSDEIKSQLLIQKHTKK